MKLIKNFLTFLEIFKIFENIFFNSKKKRKMDKNNIDSKKEDKKLK
jgi:hypothetical protein